TRSCARSARTTCARSSTARRASTGTAPSSCRLCGSRGSSRSRCGRSSVSVLVSVLPLGARHRALASLLLIAVPLLFTAQGFELLDPDEGLYAGIAQAMVTTGDWMLPHFNGLPYLEKPPLYFWLAGLTLAFDPASELALRIWSALSALGTVLLAWRMGRRLYGPTAGLMAGIALATT